MLKGHFAWECPRKMTRSMKKRSMLHTVEAGTSSGTKTPRTLGPLLPYQQTHTERIVVNGDYLVEGTDTGSWNTIWYVNTKISRHMSPTKEMFDTFKKCFFINDEERHFDPIYVHGIGEISLNTNERTYVIPYVSFVPEVNINVLSMKQLILQGFEVEVGDLKCKITHMCDGSKKETKEKKEFVSTDSKTCDKGKKPMIEEEKIEIRGSSVPVHIRTLNDFTTFMILVKSDRIAYANKQFFKRKFDEALVWFFKIKDNEEIIVPPKVSGFEVCLFDLYKLVIGHGGHEIITIKGLWNDIAQSFGFPGCYDKAFNRLFIDYLLHPHEYFVFAQKWYGKYASIESQKYGSVPDRTQDTKGCKVDDGVGTSDGRCTRGNGQEDRNATKTSDQLKDSKVSESKEAEDEDPSIDGYYSEGDKDPSDESTESEDFVIVL